MGAKYFGASVPRREDRRFLRGEGRYVDDIKLPGMLHAAFVRSPHAHARITAIRTDAARRFPGVAHVFTVADLERWLKPLPLFGAVPPGLAARVQVTMRQVPQHAMCRDVARYVGEIVAMVVAGSRALAEDAAELVEVAYEPLAPVTDMVAAAEPGAPVIHADWGSNVAVDFATGFGEDEPAGSEPLRAFGQQPRPGVVAKRRIGEDHVEGPSLGRKEALRVGDAHLQRGIAQQRRGRSQGLDQHPVPVDRDDSRGTPRGGLEGQRARAGVEIEAVLASQFLAQPVEQRFADAVRRRAQSFDGRKPDQAPAPGAADDADPVGVGGGQGFGDASRKAAGAGVTNR